MMIAIDVSFLYLVLGPLVVYGLYVLFDALGRKPETDLKPMDSITPKDPALWSDEDFLL